MSGLTTWRRWSTTSLPVTTNLRPCYQACRKLGTLRCLSKFGCRSTTLTWLLLRRVCTIRCLSSRTSRSSHQLLLVRRPGLKICHKLKKKKSVAILVWTRFYFRIRSKKLSRKIISQLFFVKGVRFWPKGGFFEPAQALRVSMEMNSHPRWLPCNRTCAWWRCDWRRRYAFLHHTKSIWKERKHRRGRRERKRIRRR